jgi:hypothetical protein
MYEKNVFKIEIVKKWHQQFRDGQENLDDDHVESFFPSQFKLSSKTKRLSLANMSPRSHTFRKQCA